MTAGRPRVLVISTAPVAGEMRGIGIRAHELARALATVADVTLAAAEGAGEPPPDIPVVPYLHQDPCALRPLIAAADAVVAQPQPPNVAAWMARSRARLIFDLYDPEVFENLALFAEAPGRLDELWVTLTLDRLTSALHMGDHFICANDAQRDLWLGAMVAERLVSLERVRRDPSFSSVIDLVPFGVPREPPAPVPGEGPRERFPIIGPQDEIVLWNGGMWSWLDPLTAVRAADLLAARRPGLRLVFMGWSRHRAAARMAEETRALAASLGLLDRVVLINDRWVPYAARGSWLLQSSCAVSTHGDHLETRFAFRTRLLDCFWAGLPVVCTRGDDLGARVERDALGATVAPGDVQGLASALEQVLDRGKATYREGLARAAEDYAWPVVTGPLVRFATATGPLARGSGVARGRLRVGPCQTARSVAYRGARWGLKAIGRGGWPSGDEGQ